MKDYNIPVHGSILHWFENEAHLLCTYTLASEENYANVWFNFQKIKELVDNFDFTSNRHRQSVARLYMNFKEHSKWKGGPNHRLDLSQIYYNPKFSNEWMNDCVANLMDTLKNIDQRRFKTMVIPDFVIGGTHDTYMNIQQFMSQSMPSKVDSWLNPHKSALKVYSGHKHFIMVDTPAIEDYSYYFQARFNCKSPSFQASMLNKNILLMMLEQNLPVYHDSYFYVEEEYIPKEIEVKEELYGTVKTRKVRHLEMKQRRSMRSLREHPFLNMIVKIDHIINSPFSILYDRLLAHRRLFQSAMASIVDARYFYMFDLYNKEKLPIDEE